MADVALSSKTIEVLFQMKEVQGTASTLDTMLLDDRVVHGSHRALFTLAAHSTTAMSIPGPASKTTYPKWVFVSGNKRLRVTYNSADATTSTPGQGTEIKGSGFYLAS